MKKLIFILFFAIISTYVKAQQPPSIVEKVNPEKFNIIIDSNKVGIQCNVIETENFYVSVSNCNIGELYSLEIKAVNKAYGYVLKKAFFLPINWATASKPILIKDIQSNMFTILSSISMIQHFSSDTNHTFLYNLKILIDTTNTNYSFPHIDSLWSIKKEIDNFYFNDAIKIDSNTILIVGSKFFDIEPNIYPTHSSCQDSSYTYIAKQSLSDGSIIWDTIYHIFPTFVEGQLKKIKQTNDSGLIILYGISYCTNPNTYRPIYASFAKLNKNFHIEWTNKFRPNGAPLSENYYAYDAVQLKDSGFMVASCLSKPGIIRLDKNGNVKWWRRYHYNGGSGISISFNNIHQINDNQYDLTGTADSIGYEIAFNYIINIDSVGNENWHRKLYGARQKYYFNQNCSSVRTSDGGFLFGGYVYSNSCYLFPNHYVSTFIKTDSLGCDGCGSCDTLTKLLATFIVNSTDSIYHGLVPVTVSNPHINCKDTLCLGERILTKFKITNGDDAYKYKVKIYGIYKSNGNISSYDDCPSQLGLELLATISNMRTDVVYSYLTEPFNNPYKDTLEGLFLYAYYNNNYYDSYEIGANTIDSTFGFFYGLRQFFRVDTTCVVGLPELPIEKAGIKLYPNPSTSYITLQSEQLMNGNISIFNNLGLVVKEEEIKQVNEKTIDIRTLPAGLYLLRYKEQTLRFMIIK